MTTKPDRICDLDGGLALLCAKADVNTYLAPNPLAPLNQLDGWTLIGRFSGYVDEWEGYEPFGSGFAGPYERSPVQRTTRVVNYRDYVPQVPTTDLGYVHVGPAYVIDFWDKKAQDETGLP